MVWITVKKVKEKKLPLMASIRLYASTNAGYKYGWDLISECWTDEDIIRFLDGTTSFDKAIAKLATVCRQHALYKYEIENA